MRAKFVFEFAKNIKSKYYAPAYLVEELIGKVEEYVPMDQIDHIVEPASGDGALIPYLDQLSSKYNIQKVDYFDLDPDPGNPRIEPQDFLDYTPKPYFDPNRLVITGPPYGEPGATSKLWIQFAKKASEIAGYVAFISPHTYLDIKNPVPNLEQIFQKNMGWIKFRGSEAFDGEDHPVKTAIFIYKTILEPEEEDFSMVDKDFKIRMYQRYKDQGKEPSEYYINAWGYNSGEVSEEGISSTGTPFSRAISIDVKNEAMRDSLEEFLSTFREEYGPLIKKYAATTQNIFHTKRFKKFLKDALYSDINESMDFDREGTPYEKLKIGSGRWKPYPKMSVEEFHDWYDKEIDRPYSNDPNWDEIFDTILNDENTSDEELENYWIAGGSDPDFIRKIIQFRSYFMDFRYVQDLPSF